MAERSRRLTIQEAIQVCEECRSENIQVRLFGGVAAAIIGESWFKKNTRYSRVPADIDLVGRKRELAGLRTVLTRRGYREARRVALDTEGERALFGRDDITIDFAANELPFCQQLDVSLRLVHSFPTLSTADLLLEKFQIVEADEKQLIDFIAIICSMKLHDRDVQRIHEIIGRKWGFWYSANLFLQKATEFAESEELSQEEREICRIESLVSNVPKSMMWRFRSLFGPLLPWHAPVEPLIDTETRLAGGEF